jgi:D-lactate dehydrogenase
MILSDILHVNFDASSSGGVIDSGVACCGMAGDRGMRFPEVIQGSTAPARMKLENCSSSSSSSSSSISVGVCVSSSRTCEAAMSQGTGRGFVSVMHVLDSCSHPKARAPAAV